MLLKSSKNSLDAFGRVWTRLDSFGRVWTCLDEFGRVWTSLERPLVANLGNLAVERPLVPKARI